MPNESNTSPRRWDPWPVSIISLFVVAIIGFATFVAFCNRHPVDLVAPDYYDQEVRYQDQMDRVKRTRESAAGAAVSFEPAQKAIVIALPAEHCKTQLTGRIDLYRPSARNLDRQFPLAPGPDGLQRIDAADLQTGLWRVRVSWTANRQDYFLDQKVVLGPMETH